MRLISNKALVSFALRYPSADMPLQAWRRFAEASNFGSFAELRVAFNSVDKVGDFYVFDIGGNKYRLVASVHFNRQMLFIRHVFTHKEYDQWKP